MQENLLKVVVYPKVRTTKKGVNFTTYSTTMNLIDEEGKVVRKSVTLKFGKDVNISNLPKGALILTCKDTDISAPTRYKIKESYDKEGNLVKTYPVVYINGIESFDKLISKAKQSQFVTPSDEVEDEELEIESEDDDTPF